MKRSVVNCSPHFIRKMVVLTTGLCVVGTVPARSLTPTYLWSHSVGDTTRQYLAAVAVDASSNVFLMGTFLGTINLGGGDLINPDFDDMFLAKFNPAGVHQWSQSFGGSGTSRPTPTSIATDMSGNVIVAGYLHGTVNFGGGSLSAGAMPDAFVAKYSSTGAHLWSWNFGDWYGTGAVHGLSVATDASGNVIVVGQFEGTLYLGPNEHVSAGSMDIFILKVNSAGAFLWSKSFGDVGWQTARWVATDASQNVIVEGYFDQGTLNFGGGNLVNAGSRDIFLVKFNSAGVHQWSQSFGGPQSQEATCVAVDASGNVILPGIFYGTVNFGGGNLTSAGLGDAFIAKFNPSGVHQWSRRYGSSGDENGRLYLTTDSARNLIIGGSLAGTLDLGGGSLTTAGGLDIIAAKLNPEGGHVWSQHFGDTSDQSAYSVAADAAGNVILAGRYQGTVDFGGGSHTSAGQEDIFVVKFMGQTVEPLITSIMDIGNDQGRRVRAEFERSGYDGPGGSITRYEAYRRNDALAAPLAEKPAGALTRTQLLDQGWVYAGWVPAHVVDVYLMDAPTDADSTIAHGQHYSAFFIRAATDDPLTYYDSPVDSGYSLDNLAPAAIGGFAYNAGVLSWKKSTAEDLDFFSVYGGNTDSFGRATLIDYATAPTMDVSASPHEYYFVTATDIAGNESKPAVVAALTGASGMPKNYVLSISAYPNPFNPETTIRYTVPSKGRVMVAIYDTRGARVAQLVDMEREGGAYTEVWTGHDDAGRPVSSGVYFARVTHPSGTKSYKVVMLK